jgi:hypothetical protein
MSQKMKKVITLLGLIVIFTFVEISGKVDLEFISIIDAYHEECNEDDTKEPTNI